MAGRLTGGDFKTGTGRAVNSTAENVTIIVAPGAGKTLMILSGYVQVNLAATGGAGEVALEDGLNGTKFFRADADAVGHFKFRFDPPGFPLTVNTLLNLTVDGAVTNEASATATVVADVRG